MQDQESVWMLRLTIFAGFAALAAFYLSVGNGTVAFVDPDVWHEMALIREALAIGRLPLVDPFAFTSSVEPLIHHEWGTGAVLYWVGTTFGATGLGILRDLLAFGAGLFCVLCARRRGAGAPVLFMTLPLAIFLAWVGVTTVRAQMFTLLFLACLLWFLELDREGRRWWIVPWLAMYVAWVNLHAGFVVGVIAFACYAVGRLLQGDRSPHLLLVAGAMALLVAANPYGTDYYGYLWYGLRLDRTGISEWQPVWEAWWPMLVVYGVTLMMAAYGLVRSRHRGRDAGELLFLLAAAYAAARHQRHLSIHAIAWACYVPALLQRSPLGGMLRRGLDPRKRSVALGAVVAFVGAVSFHFPGPFNPPTVPANSRDHGRLIYPVGAVEYLRDSGFQGNLITPFEVGAFVTWKLHPDVLVSLDGRFEVAYEPTLLGEHSAFFRAESGWESFAALRQADAVLTRSDAQVVGGLEREDGWYRVYRDDSFDVFARSGMDLLPVDRRGRRFMGRFP